MSASATTVPLSDCALYVPFLPTTICPLPSLESSKLKFLAVIRPLFFIIPLVLTCKKFLAAKEACEVSSLGWSISVPLPLITPLFLTNPAFSAFIPVDPLETLIVPLF